MLERRRNGPALRLFETQRRFRQHKVAILCRWSDDAELGKALWLEIEAVLSPGRAFPTLATRQIVITWCGRRVSGLSVLHRRRKILRPTSTDYEHRMPKTALRIKVDEIPSSFSNQSSNSLIERHPSSHLPAHTQRIEH
jgi:hypothetical protein